MNNSSDETKILAAKLLAQLLASEEKNSNSSTDLSAEVLSRLDELNSRLVQIENKINASETTPQNFIKPTFPVFLHSSQERFALEDDAENEKACRFEPGGKPCDHCAMCSSRGF